MASATHTLFGHLDDPAHMALFYVWLRHSGWRPLPSESEIDFEDLAPILSHVGLVDALDDGQRFRYRHIGPWSAALLWAPTSTCRGWPGWPGRCSSA